MQELVFIVVSAALINNFVLVQFLGLCPFMGISGRLDAALGMGIATTFVLTLAATLSHLLNSWLLEPFGLDYLRTLGFILVIAVVVQFTEITIRRRSPLLQQILGLYLPLITSNCAVLGVALISANRQHTLIEAMLFGFGAALGFTLVLVLFSAIRERLDSADVPAPFQGPAIALVTAGILSLAFIGFQGMAR